uniref:Uncharacterized protein n=1 Tax=Hommersandiophycus borowitzkae TaxID=268573 RepID=A0A1G4NTZ7_9FLOR|nr:Hypothetical protein ORF_5 [Hommersandiophycus borowitzkae]SCW22152.1 Hypothetical protein ORF_5 [Hommersandiophycus borowitzkae]
MIIFNQSINVPIYWFAKMSNQYKLIIISLYIVLVPFYPIYLLLFQHIVLIIIYRLEFYDYPILYKRWCLICLLIYSFYFLSIFITPNIPSLSINIQYHVKIYMPFLVLWKNLLGGYLYISHYSGCIYQSISLSLPIIVTRSYLILINYLSLYNFIVTTTHREKLIIGWINLILNTKTYNSFINDIMIIIMLSTELIDMLIYKYKYNQTAIMLRGLTKLQVIYSTNYVVKLFIVQYRNLSIKLISNIVYSLYMKELLYRYLNLWLLI